MVGLILTLFGVAFLLMGETQNKIAENEKLSAQALYFAEAGTRQVKRWFDRPRGTTGYAWNLHNPPLAVMRRDLRMIDPDGPGPTAAALTDGNAGGSLPNYKQGIDNNGDGYDDVFDRPYRAQTIDMFLGTADGPDIRIDRAYKAASKTFLDTLSERLLANFPVAAANIAARISRIDVYAPPYLQIGGNWTRYGVATVAVTAQVVKTENGAERILAQRTMRAWLRDHMGFALTKKRGQADPAQKDVIINGRPCRNPSMGIGIFDIISMPKIGKHYRILRDKKGRHKTIEINAECARTRLAKIRGKTIVPGGKVQLNLRFGANILADNRYKPGDSIVISLSDEDRFTITDHFPFAVGNMAMVIGGKHSGKIAKITGIQKVPGSVPNRVTLTDASTGAVFDTVETYLYMVGRETPALSEWGIEE